MTLGCLAVFGLGGCKSDAEKACFDKPPSDKKTWISACGEACEKKVEKACAKVTEIANKHCIEKGDIAVCSWACNYAKTGAKLYCKRQKALESERKAK